MSQDYITTKQVVDYMKAASDAQRVAWGLNGIYEWDNNLTPLTPALLLIGLPRTRVWTGTHHFTLTFRVVMFVVNANMNISKSARQAACEDAANNIVAYWDTDQTLGGHIVQGWVETDSGGEISIKPSSTVWTGHRIEWRGENRQVIS